MTRRACAPAVGSALLPLLGGCSVQHYQSMIGGGGADDHQFMTLFAIFLVICLVMYVVVITALTAGIVRRRRPGVRNVVEEGRHHRSDAALHMGLRAWAAVIGVTLAGLAVASFFTDRSMAQPTGKQKLSVTVTANQWWWDITYNSGDTSKMVRTANELHLPVGVPVRIFLKSNDVIHSFWVPSLAGKQDLIPGRDNDITLVPTRAGIYRGQCAEYCGAQHAHMSFVVEVQSYADFIRWWNHQLQPAIAPTAPLVVAGYHYVTTGPCSTCHAIAGTPAGGTVGPDLTHLATRRSIAAGTMPMSEGNLYGWVEDPQSLKPGNHMPTIGLRPDQLHAVVAYLGTLK
jgi:cytochrome c oxidase subunit 2